MTSSAARGAGAQGGTTSSAPPARPRKRRSQPPAKKGKPRRLTAVGWASIGFGIFAAVGIAMMVMLAVFARSKGPGEGQRFIVEVPKGASTREVAKLLADAGLVESEQLMAFYLALSATGDAIPGEHLILGGGTPGDIATCLSRGAARKQVKVVVPEGWNRFQIAERVETLGVASKSSFIKASGDPLLLESLDVPARPGQSPQSAEGYLFPATYEFAVDTPARDIVERLVAESNTRWRRIIAAHSDAYDELGEKFGWTRSEIITLASMVEKEAVVDEERPLIAGVFLNRLSFPDFTPRLLQSDPTSGYGCLVAPDVPPSCAEYSGKITPAMNRDKLNRYSTYTNEGLPPGPIANPGERSIKAVLAPTPSKFLFFVASGGGKHKFSETLDDHNRAIQK